MSEPSHFQRVHYAVICVSAVRYLESWCAVWFKLVLVVLDDSAVVRGQVTLRTEEGRVGEEDVRFS